MVENARGHCGGFFVGNRDYHGSFCEGVSNAQHMLVEAVAFERVEKVRMNSNVGPLRNGGGAKGAPR